MCNTLDSIACRIDSPVDVAIILGSGLGAFAETFEDATAVSTGELPGYPVSTVPGHAGKIVTGRVGKLRVLAFQGRIHQYEGYAPSEVVIPVRLAHRLGAKILIVTNASGAMTRRFSPGDLLLIDDHINLQFRNPLRGPRMTGDLRFPDMANAYDRELCDLAERVALEQRIPLQRGVLAGMLGPTYETPAETRMLAGIGADAGCMSTVPEVICAAGLGLRVLGISCVTNWAAGINDAPLDHEDVQRVAAEASERFAALLRGVLGEIGNRK
ncbi:MAG TPA: purine-nucleoside phosphorylase [bacterium]